MRLSGEPSDMAIFEQAGAIIRQGGLVAFPTETVYGLGGNGLNAASSGKIYAAKGRPSDNPLILHIAERRELTPLVENVPELAEKLMDAFWPGPMTLIFRRSALVPKETTGGLDTVAVRMPSHPAARKLILAAGVPIAAPSANLSGRPSTTTAAHVWEDLAGRIEMILDGGPSDIGLESTIIDVTGPQPMILRPGYIGLEHLQALLGEVAVDPTVFVKPDASLRPKAPGMKYRHYAPKSDVILVEGRTEQVTDYILREAAAAAQAGKRVGVLCCDESLGAYDFGEAPVRVLSLGTRSREESIAHNLFDTLRELDTEGLELVYSEVFAEGELGMAIMNRLRKAAGYHIVKV